MSSSLLDKLNVLDRRWIFLAMALAVASPILMMAMRFLVSKDGLYHMARVGYVMICLLYGSSSMSWYEYVQ